MSFLVVGLSHIFQAHIWISFFKYLAELNHTGNILNALLALSSGAFVVSFHFIWKWPTVIVTVLGLMLFVKGAAYLLFPN